MKSALLTPQPLTAEAFAPFGQVIESGVAAAGMNAGRFDRFDRLCHIDVDGKSAVGIVSSTVVSPLPYLITEVERHPLGSQAFIPLSPFSFVVVVAKASEEFSAENLRAFVTNGEQGINYARGTWHMPLIASAIGQRFLVIDRERQSDNCDIVRLEHPIQLCEPG